MMGAFEAKPKARANGGHLPKAARRNLRQIRVIRPWELEDEPDLEPLIDGIKFKRTINTTIGQTGKGKTLIKVHEATHLAMGWPWCGRDVEQGAVIYFIGEDPDNLKARFRGYWQAHEIDPRSCPVDIIEERIDLVHGDGDLNAIICAIEGLGHERIAEMIFDTTSTIIGGEKEDEKWFGKLADNADKLRAHFGCAIDLVHHLGKDEEKGSRGSTVLPAKVSTEFTVRQPSPTRIEIVDSKQRGATTGKNRLVFNIKTHTYPSKTGREITVPYVEWDQEATTVAAPAFAKPQRLRGVKAIGYQAAVDVCNEHQLEPPASAYIPEYVRGAREDHWRELCYARGITSGESASAKRLAFHRLKNDLVGLQRVCLHDGFLWVPTDRFKAHGE